MSQRGGGLLTLGGGAAYAEGGYRDTPLAEILPLAIGSGADDPGEGATLEPVFRELRIRPTRAGSTHPVVRLDPDPTANRNRFAALPLLSTVNRAAAPKPGAITLLEGEAATGRGAEPVLAFQRFGRGRVASLTIQDFWLWQMHATIPLEDETHEILWRRLLRFLAADAPRQIEAAAAPVRALPGERVAITARVEDERFLAINRATVEATLVAPDGAAHVVPLRWTGARHGEYSGSFVPEDNGLHRVEVRANGAGLDAAVATEPATAFFEAGNVEDEFFGAAADVDLATRIADETGGRVFSPDAARALAQDLRYTESGVTVVERRDLWNLPAIFFLMFGLLASEWGLRRRWGLR